ncbi:hypothetical protein M422DRAFT_75814 [Sphaerobolus stellatus SS14]|uniref:Lysophospholipase n=1 Tax=Sphaerobolus stellatus (strain SS14) TaxID=990650 RepID=A0A0C9VPA2_SPHS4|nr:hypothetical protein M422DRAFT_75814 [Sphaerobolus stellatus SS14]
MKAVGHRSPRILSLNYTRRSFGKHLLSQHLQRRDLTILRRVASNSAVGRYGSNVNPWIKWTVLGASSALLGITLVDQTRPLSTSVNEEKELQKKTHEDKAPKTKESEEVQKPDSPSWHGLSFLTASLPVTSISSTLSTWDWPSLPDLPDVSRLQAQFSTLMLELGLGPGSLYSQIVNEAPDPAVHPECEWDAQVRLGDELCIPERAFLRERKRKMKKAFADFIGVRETEINEEDIPIVAIAGSGGGYRAMLNTIGSLTGAKSAGLFDCVAYTAGISGSCWSLGILYSGVAGSNNPTDAGQHAKERIKLSYVDTSTLEALITHPTNKYLLTGILRKASSPGGDVSLVDLYGTFVASRILTPTDLSKLDPRHLSLHHFRKNVDTGDLPLPIFTALQHAIPPSKVESLQEAKRQKDIAVDDTKKQGMQAQQRHLEAVTQSRWLWYEFTPYEVGCDELGAWIPSWALGRQFNNGKSLDRRPELSFTILCGMFASAFCASLKHYFAEVQPTLKLLPVQFHTWLEEIITENEQDLGLIHPVIPDKIPNFVKGLTGQLRTGSPDEVTEQDTLGFMDAGAELNIPYYPLLRRNIDCIIALDASADSQDLWFKRAEELAIKRGLSTWPRGARWPIEVFQSNDIPREETSIEKDAAETANRDLAEKQESELTLQTERQADSERRELHVNGDPGAQQTSRTASASASKTGVAPLNSCEVWIGTSKPEDSEAARLEEIEEESLSKRDGIGIVYMPLVPNEKAAPQFDPSAVSTWRREVSPEESQNILEIAEANFTEGVPKIRKLLRAIWLRKKRDREARQTEIDIIRTFSPF